MIHISVRTVVDQAICSPKIVIWKALVAIFKLPTIVMGHHEHRGQSGDISIQRYMAVCCIRCQGCYYSTPGIRVTAKMWESSDEDTQSPTRA